MRRFSSYRVWVYFFNGILIFLQLIFIHAFWIIWLEPRMRLFPLERIEFLVVLTLFSLAVQFCTCVSGIFGVYFSNSYVVRIYWLLMLPVLVFDTIQIVLWAYAFSRIHEEFESELPRVFEDQLIANGPSDFLKEFVCQEWNAVQIDLSCCAPTVVLQNCYDTTGRCNLPTNSNCHFPLMRWLHSNTDILAILLYLIIYPIKWISVCVLREDIHEIFSENFYSKNQALYKHWLVIEQQESDDSQQSSQLSSPNEYTLVSTNGQNGSLINCK